MRALGFKGVDKELDAVFDTFDSDGSGEIDYRELHGALRQGGRLKRTSTSSEYEAGLLGRHSARGGSRLSRSASSTVATWNALCS